MERIEACEGFEVLQAYGATRWAVYRDSRSIRCDKCGEYIRGVYRFEVTRGGSSRFVCTSHPNLVVVPRVVGLEVEGIPAPRAGSYGARRLEALAARGAA